MWKPELFMNKFKASIKTIVSKIISDDRLPEVPEEAQKAMMSESYSPHEKFLMVCKELEPSVFLAPELKDF